MGRCRVVWIVGLLASAACGTLTDPGPSLVIVAGDASTDGAVRDADARDGSTDGSAPGVDGDCAAFPNAIVCADFEEPGGVLPTGGFDFVVNGPPDPVLAVVPDNGTHSLRVSAASGTSKKIYLSKQLPSTPATLTFGARIRRGQANVDAHVEYLVVQTGANADMKVVVAGDTGNTLRVLDSSGSAAAVIDHAFNDFPTGFTRIEMKLFFESGGTFLQVSRNGTVTQDKTRLQSAAGTKTISGPLDFSAGLYDVSSATNGFDAFLDDVTLVTQ